MITVFILAAQMVGGGFSMLPYDSQDACRAAMAGLPPAIVAEAECFGIEMIAPGGSRLAPEKAPLPPRKLGQSA